MNRFTFDFWGSLCRDGEAGGAPGAGGAPAPAPGGAPAPGAPAPSAPASLLAAAGGGAPAPAPGAPAPGAPAPGAPAPGAPAPAAGAAYYPEGLSNEYRGANDRETIEKMHAAINGRPKPPATPADYAFNLPPALQERVGDLKDDPVVPIWRDIAHKHGLSNEQFSAIYAELHDGMEKAGLLDAPVDYAGELKQLEPITGDAKAKAAAAAQRVQKIDTFVKDLLTRATIDKTDVPVLTAMYANAASVKAFEKILGLIPTEHGLQGGGSGAGAYSWTQADADMADERYSTNSPKHDPAFRKAADEKMGKLTPRKGYSLT